MRNQSRRKYDNSNIKLKVPMIRSNLCDYSDAPILVQGTIKVPNMAAAVVRVNNTNKKVIIKNCTPFTNCITEISNTQKDKAQDIDIVMSMYHTREMNHL